MLLIIILEQVHLFELIFFILIHLIVITDNVKNVQISELLFEVLLILTNA